MNPNNRVFDNRIKVKWRQRESLISSHYTVHIWTILVLVSLHHTFNQTCFFLFFGQTKLEAFNDWYWITDVTCPSCFKFNYYGCCNVVGLGFACCTCAIYHGHLHVASLLRLETLIKTCFLQAKLNAD